MKRGLGVTRLGPEDQSPLIITTGPQVKDQYYCTAVSFLIDINCCYDCSIDMVVFDLQFNNSLSLFTFVYKCLPSTIILFIKLLFYHLTRVIICFR